MGNGKRNRRGNQSGPSFLVLVYSLASVEEREDTDDDGNADERPGAPCSHDYERGREQDHDCERGGSGRFGVDTEQGLVDPVGWCRPFGGCCYRDG